MLFRSPRKKSQLLVLAVLLGAAVLGGAVAVFTVASKKAETPTEQKG